MNKEDLLKRIKALNESYRMGRPIVSDADYDEMVEQLRSMDPDNDWFKRIEPGYSTQGRKAKLPVPMKSLKKAKSLGELKAWAASIGLRGESVVVLTPKFDGLSLLYEEATGKAYSRGGSENEGMDCTDHARMAAVPRADTGLKFTYGEFLFSKEDWEERFPKGQDLQGESKYKSPRNTAVGLLMQNKPSELLKYGTFFRYGADSESMSQFRTYQQFYEYACRKYGQRPLLLTLKLSEMDEQTLETVYHTWNSIFYCDGVVVYANDLSVWESAGRQENTGNPNYAIAYKHPSFATLFSTTALGIQWNVSRVGLLKPIVQIEEVDTGGCIMANPTGYNAKFIRDNCIAPGAKLNVKMAGGIIPNIDSVEAPAPQESIDALWKSLEKCPVCGAPTEWSDTGTDLVCANPNCSGRNLAAIIEFYKTVGAKNVGEDTLTLLFNNGYKTLRSMLRISFADLVQTDGIGEVKANFLLYANKQILEGVDITDLMAASNCFKGIRSVKAKEILSKMSEGEQWAFINGRYNIAEEYFQTVSFQKAPKVMQSFYKGIRPFYEFIAKNGLAIRPMKPQALVTNSKYKGVRACFSGFRDKVLEDLIIAGGGEIASGVTKKTTHLVVLDKDGASSKISKAKELGIPILTPNEIQIL